MCFSIKEMGTKEGCGRPVVMAWVAVTLSLSFIRGNVKQDVTLTIADTGIGSLVVISESWVCKSV